MGRLPAGGHQGAMYLVNWPAAWMERYVADNLASQDIVVREALRSPEPFTWADLRARYPGEAARVFAATASFGWHEGFGVPVHGPAEARG